MRRDVNEAVDDLQQKINTNHAALQTIVNALWLRMLKDTSNPYHWVMHYDEQTRTHSDCDCEQADE